MAKQFDFDRLTERRHTDSVKWDGNSNPDALPLWVADMDFETAPAVTDAIRRRAAHGIYGYSFPGDSYYSALTGWFERRHGWHIDRGHVVVTTGVVPAVSAILKALVPPRGKVVLQTPAYNCFFSCISNNGLQTVESPLLRSGDSYVMNYDELDRLCDDPLVTVFILCNPHNPAGRVWTADELRRVDEICSRHGVTVLSDEIHCEIVMPGYSYTPFATVATGRHVTCCSPSKAFNLAGLQTANIIAGDARQRAAIDRAVNINETCDIGPFGIVALEAAYNHGEEWLDALCGYIAGNYALLCERLKTFGPKAKVCRLEGTYLAWVDVRAVTDNVAGLCLRLENEYGVRLTAGTTYGADGEGYVRINLATQRARLAEALERIARALS